jgi:Antibiotic biosynthesis monooxygenase
VVARITTFRGTPEQMAEGNRVYREAVGPWLREATGFRGFIALSDPARNRGLMISFWATEELARDEERSGMKLRDEVAKAVETTIEDVSFLEVLTLDIPPLGDGEPEPDPSG